MIADCNSEVLHRQVDLMNKNKSRLNHLDCTTAHHGIELASRYLFNIKTSYLLFLGLIFFGCTNHQEEDTFLRNIIVYKQAFDVTNLKYYLLYVVDESKLDSVDQVIFLIEKGLLGLKDSSVFSMELQSLNPLISGIRLALDDRPVASAQQLEQYLERDKAIIENPKLSAYVASILLPALTRMKVNIEAFSSYQIACSTYKTKNVYVETYLRANAQYYKILLAKMEDLHDYAKILSAEALSQLEASPYKSLFKAFRSEFAFEVLLQKLDTGDAVHLTEFKNYIKEISPKDGLIRAKLETNMAIHDSEGEAGIDSTFYQMDYNEACARMEYAKHYVFSTIQENNEALKCLNLTIQYSEKDPCNWYYIYGKQSKANLLTRMNRDKEATSIWAGLKQGQCSKVLHGLDSKIQLNLAKSNYYLRKCEEGFSTFCIMADSILTVLESSPTMQGKKDELHLSDMWAEIGLKKLRVITADAMKKGVDNNEIISLFKKCKEREALKIYSLIVNKDFSDAERKKYDSLDVVIKENTNIISELRFQDAIKSKAHQEILRAYEEKQIIIDNSKKDQDVALKPNDGIPLNSLQDILEKQNAQYFDFLYDENYLYILYINSQEFKIKRIDLNQGLKESIEGFKLLVKQRKSSIDSISMYSSTIFDAIMGPLIRENNRTIFLSASGNLYDLAFEGLKDKHGKYLFEKYNIRNIFNIGMLRPISDHLAPKSLSLFAFSDEKTMSTKSEFSELIFSQKEVEAISKIFNKKAKTYSGTECSEQNVIKSLNSDIVHFSTHAVSDPINRMNNYLVLREQQNIKKYYGFQFLSYDIGAKLIVLNGCETQIGPQFKGEGSFSLARNLINKQIENVISTRWKINDNSAKQFMVKFYEHLLETKSVRESLRQARYDMLKSPKFAHPYFWASYSLY